MVDVALEHTTDGRGVTTLELSRADRHNALDRALIDALHAALDEVVGRTRVLILRGAGKSFCAGADLDWMRRSVDLDEADNRADTDALANLLLRLDTFPCPTIARVHGAALGGGAGLVACCDIAIASDEARFAFPEVRLGLIPATISPYVMRAIGTRAARRWFLSGARFDALEALRLGLVHDVCSTSNLDHRIDERLVELLAGGPEALAASKRLVAELGARPIDEHIARAAGVRLADIRSGAEAQEGLAAFIDKRDPAWRT